MTLRFSVILLFLFIFIIPNNRAMSAQPTMSDREKEVVSQMGDIYAAHVFAGHCKKSYGFYLSNQGDIAIANSPQLSKALSEGCACMAKILTETTPSDTVIKYVMYRANGWPEEVKTPAQIERFIRANGMTGLFASEQDAATRKKCGFLR